MKLSPEDIATAVIKPQKYRNIYKHENTVEKMKFNVRRRIMFLKEFYKCVRVGDIQNIREMLSSIVEKDKIPNDCFIRDTQGRRPLHLSVARLLTTEAVLLRRCSRVPCDGTRYI